MVHFNQGYYFRDLICKAKLKNKDKSDFLVSTCLFAEIRDRLSQHLELYSDCSYLDWGPSIPHQSQFTWFLPSGCMMSRKVQSLTQLGLLELLQEHKIWACEDGHRRRRKKKKKNSSLVLFFGSSLNLDSHCPSLPKEPRASAVPQRLSSKEFRWPAL